ncbi:hypothetical protein NDU88_004085 [Pleurodeles waltl]|uniref:Secreted protein n=1 Tax=Pleurodeles waltl TaxID=8319 RepID=A0AAV7NMF9_PLEWA|nr:hypothetical protein NDU88_004085 [Pleurodeles waltl]
MFAMSAVVALSVQVAGLVAVVAVVSVAEMMPVVHVSAPVEGDSRMSPAASDSCPLGMMLGTVAEAADMQVVVQVAVSTAYRLLFCLPEGVTPVPQPEAPCPVLTSP